MFKETSVKKYLLRTLCLMLALAMVLVLFYPLAMDTAAKRKIYAIIIASVAGAVLVAYWIYIFIREYRLAHPIKKKAKGDNGK